MTNDTLKLTTLAAAIAALPALAFAQLNVGDATGTTEAEIRAVLEAKGAEVLEVEFEDGEIEVEYILEGVEYEAEIDPATGLVAELETEDDDEEDDDNEDEDDDDGEEDKDDS